MIIPSVPEGIAAPSPQGADELAAAHAVMELCRENPELWRTVFRLRSVFSWTLVLKELTKS